jgi:hypothetical protein
MNFAHDVYAETNPALYASVLASFAKAYESVQPEGPELPVAYLFAPVALSGDLAPAFGGTNKNTGLLEWLERSPGVRVGLAERVNASMEFVTAGLRFGCFASALELGADGRMRTGARGLKASATARLDDYVIQALKRAERLGFWCAMAGSTRNVFDVMGLTV